MAPKSISFAKNMRRSDMAAMPIPEAVYDKHRNGALLGTVVLELGGKDWQVEVCSGSFTTGWKEFWLDNAITEGDCLVFHHDTAKRFAIELFGSDGSAKGKGASSSSPLKTSREEKVDEQNENKAATIERVVKDCLVHLEDGSSLKFVVSKVPPRVVELGEEPASPLATVRASDAPPPSSRTRSSQRRAPEPVAKTPLSAAEDDFPRPPKKPKIATPKEVETRASPRLTRGNTPKSREKISAARPSSKGKSLSSSSGKKPGVVSDSPALPRAQAFKTSNPSIVLVMRKGNVAPSYYLNLPREFAVEHLPSENKELSMVDTEGKTWNLKWLGPKRSFSGGWGYVVQHHKLDVDDACVLEVVAPDRVRITIFKVNGNAGTSDPAAPAAGAIPNRPSGVANEEEKGGEEEIAAAAAAAAAAAEEGEGGGDNAAEIVDAVLSEKRSSGDGDAKATGDEKDGGGGGGGGDGDAGNDPK